MNNYRQQAAGNLITSLYTNKIVILNNKNPLKQTFKEWGLSVFDKDILKSETLTVNTKHHNKEKINKKMNSKNNKTFFDFLKR